MKIQGKHYRSVWAIGEDAFGIIDQARLPHEFVTMTLRSAEDAARVIRNMNTRGAPLIGVVGAYGLALAVRDDASDDAIQEMVEMLAETRPTAINLKLVSARTQEERAMLITQLCEGLKTWRLFIAIVSGCCHRH